MASGAGRVVVLDGGRRVEVDLVRVWLLVFGRVLLEREMELADGFRRWREVVRGGRERSCFMGSAVLAVDRFGAVVLETRFDEERCKPPVLVALLILDRGRKVELPFALGGLPDIDSGREGLTVGRRLGDWAFRGMLLASLDGAFASLGSAVDRPYLLVPFSPGLRRERVREGIPDISFVDLFVDVIVVVVGGSGSLGGQVWQGWWSEVCGRLQFRLLSASSLPLQY